MDDDRGLRHDGGQERLARRMLRYPDCGQARCTGCGATHVVLDADLLPRLAYTADLTGP